MYVVVCSKKDILVELNNIFLWYGELFCWSHLHVLVTWLLPSYHLFRSGFNLKPKNNGWPHSSEPSINFLNSFTCSCSGHSFRYLCSTKDKSLNACYIVIGGNLLSESESCSGRNFSQVLRSSERDFVMYMLSIYSSFYHIWKLSVQSFNYVFICIRPHVLSTLLTCNHKII